MIDIESLIGTPTNFILYLRLLMHYENGYCMFLCWIFQRDDKQRGKGTEFPLRSYALTRAHLTTFRGQETLAGYKNDKSE